MVWGVGLLVGGRLLVGVEEDDEGGLLVYEGGVLDVVG